MNELRYNPLNRRWVTIASERGSRPGDFASKRLPVEDDPGRPCPFCPGNEGETDSPLETYGAHGHWLVRVVPNLYPAFLGEGAMKIEDHGPLYRSGPANGIHEVLVLSPDHNASWADLDDKQCGLIMAAVRDRIEDHARMRGVEYTQTIVNHGREAGASIEHPHGQLLGIPFVPGELTEELAGYAEYTSGPLLESIIEDEEKAAERVVSADDRIVVVCPYWSGSPYEMLVIPRVKTPHIDDAAPADLAAAGRAVRDSLVRMRRVLGEVAYNIVFHSAPHHRDVAFHWHIHIVPQVTTAAGFEQGTGVKINVVPPERAARQLHGVDLDGLVKH